MSESTEQQAPKRRRKSGWDVQTPVESTSAPSNEALLQQQAQQAMLAQQLALQKAHQLIAQQADYYVFITCEMLLAPHSLKLLLLEFTLMIQVKIMEL